MDTNRFQIYFVGKARLLKQVSRI